MKPQVQLKCHLSNIYGYVHGYGCNIRKKQRLIATTSDTKHFLENNLRMLQGNNK